jgi:hypothetical protein
MSDTSAANRSSGIQEPLLVHRRQPLTEDGIIREALPGDLNHDNTGHRATIKAILQRTLVVAVLWTGALGIALGQHLFYSFLNHSEIQNSFIPQAWVVRIGTALAFVFKSLLTGAIAVIYAQVFWFSVQQSAVRAGSLDAMFGVLNNPLLFFNRDLLQKTPLLFVIAIVSWLIPISAVIAPGALTGCCPCLQN